jgi:hypothetical protein
MPGQIQDADEYGKKKFAMKNLCLLLFFFFWLHRQPLPRKRMITRNVAVKKLIISSTSSDGEPLI